MCVAHAYASSSVLGEGGKGHHPRFLAGHRNDIGSRGWRVVEGLGELMERGPPPAHTSTGLSTSGPTPGIILTPSRDSGQALALSRLRRTFSQSREWGLDTAHPPHRGTLTPFIPLSLRAFNGEGEIRTEADACAMHMRMPLVRYWGEGWNDEGFGGGSEGGLEPGAFVEFVGLVEVLV